MAIISTTGPSGISVTQMLWRCIDWTDPENPVFKTSGSGGGALPAGNALIGRVKPAVISQAIDVAAISVSSSAGGSDLFATADSTRQHIVFRNTSSVDCWAQPFGATPQVGRGFCLKANGGEKAFTGDYAGAAWKAIAASGTGTISIGGAKT